MSRTLVRGTVVHFVTHPGGGVWSVVKALAACHRPRWRTMLAAVHRGPLDPGIAADAQRLFDRWIFVRRPAIPGIYYLAPLRVAAALGRLEVEESLAPVVHHFHAGPYTPWVYRLPRQPQGGKWLTTFHGSRGNFGDTHSRLKLWLHVAGVRILRERGFTLVAVSRRSAEDCAAMYDARPSDFQVRYNGVPPAPTAPEARHPGRPFRVGFAGTIMPVKGWRKVVTAVEQLRNQGVHVCCRLAGNGPEYPALRQLAVKHSDWLEALGHVPQPQRELYPTLDALVLPSDFEGHPMVVLEALACGVPCICSDVGGCAETVRHDQEGYILRENTVPEIAAHLRRMATEEGLWPRLSRNCVARHAEMFTAEKMAAAWEQLYLEGNGR